jgi:alpha-glucosidase (family GH31 glycosyl hydrolase)
MYPEVLPYIRTAIERRYELIPYLYALSWEAATQGKG